jgi:hypothetical protein
MKIRDLTLGSVLLCFGLAGTAGAGCTATASGGAGSTSSSGAPPPSTRCTANSTLLCTGNAAGFECTVGDNPEAEDPNLSCSTPQPDGGTDDFCCFDWSAGFSSCTPDDELTSVCPDFNSYGYQCNSGDDPASLDPNLVCSTMPVMDPDGIHDDFCCTYQ